MGNGDSCRPVSHQIPISNLQRRMFTNFGNGGIKGGTVKKTVVVTVTLKSIVVGRGQYRVTKAVQSFVTTVTVSMMVVVTTLGPFL